VHPDATTETSTRPDDDDPLARVAADENLLAAFAQAEADSQLEDHAFLAWVEARHEDYATAGASRPGDAGTYNTAADRADDLEQAWQMLEDLHPDWYKRAACHGLTERFFPTSPGAWRKLVTRARSKLPRRRPGTIEVWTGPHVEAINEICRGCPVRAECLASALERDERYGLWGGLTPNERAALLKTGASPFAALAAVQQASGSTDSDETEATEEVA
jgi:WhiB family redox-sensing transcriptional regulator